MDLLHVLHVYLVIIFVLILELALRYAKILKSTLIMQLKYNLTLIAKNNFMYAKLQILR